MNLNILFWERFIRKQFITQVKLFVENVEKRLIPTFDSIEKEAESIQQQVWNNICSSSSSPDVDPSDLAEKARDAGIEYYEMVSGVKQALLNICATSLYHLYEQQVIFMLRREILHPSLENDINLLNVKTFKEELQKFDVDITQFSSWPVIDELRLVSNSVKHAEGSSAAELRKINPDIFENPVLKKYGTGFKNSSSWLYMPLAGDDLYVGIDDLKKYQNGIVTFWNEYISVLSQMTQ
jgi:hypothetical protein